MVTSENKEIIKSAIAIVLIIWTVFSIGAMLMDFNPFVVKIVKEDGPKHKPLEYITLNKNVEQAIGRNDKEYIFLGELDQDGHFYILYKFADSKETYVITEKDVNSDFTLTMNINDGLRRSKYYSYSVLSVNDTVLCLHWTGN